MWYENIIHDQKSSLVEINYAWSTKKYHAEFTICFISGKHGSTCEIYYNEDFNDENSKEIWDNYKKVKTLTILNPEDPKIIFRKIFK